MFVEAVGGAGCVGGQEVDGVFPERPQNFRHQRRQVDDCSPEWRRTAEQGAEHFMAKWIAAVKARARLRHAVVCPNVTEGPRRGWPKASGLVLVRLPLLTSHKWRELVSSGRLICRCYVVFLRCYVCFCFASFSSKCFN